MDSVLAEQLISFPKSIANWSGFKPRANHAKHIIGTAQLLNELGVYFPGFTIEIEVKTGIVVAECMIQMSLRQAEHGKRKIVYQLEIGPAHKKTHSGSLSLYGPHEHIGDAEPNSVEVIGVECGYWDDSIQWFLKRVNITPISIGSPYV